MSSRCNVGQVNDCSTVDNISSVVCTVDDNCYVSAGFVARNMDYNNCSVVSCLDIKYDSRFNFKFNCSVCLIVYVIAIIGYICSVVSGFEIFNCQFGSAVCEVYIVSCTVYVYKNNSCCV